MPEFRSTGGAPLAVGAVVGCWRSSLPAAARRGRAPCGAASRAGRDARQPLPRAARLFVDVVGAVRRPGLYRLAGRFAVADAVRRAGGPTPKAQIELVNLAARVADGEQIVVPRRGSPFAARRCEPAPGGRTARSISTAPRSSSSTRCPASARSTAQKILDYRQEHGAFGSVDELDAISGIGPARLEAAARPGGAVSERRTRALAPAALAGSLCLGSRGERRAYPGRARGRLWWRCSAVLRPSRAGAPCGPAGRRARACRAGGGGAHGSTRSIAVP